MRCRNNLGLQVLGYSVLWAGISGMPWDELVPIVHSMTNCFGIPKMVLIHCGGNDIGIEIMWVIVILIITQAYQCRFKNNNYLISSNLLMIEMTKE
jgi:hypothetical protein